MYALRGRLLSKERGLLWHLQSTSQIYTRLRTALENASITFEKIIKRDSDNK